MPSLSSWFRRPRSKPTTPILPTLALHDMPSTPPPDYESKPDPNLHIEDKKDAAYLPVLGATDTHPSATKTTVHSVPVTTTADEPEITNVVILLKEDYISAKAYMRELDYKDALKHLIKRTLWKWYAIIGLIIVFSVLVTVKHDEIIHYLHPIIKTIRSWPAGWMIPIVILVIVSYPPLVGHEIIGILIGLVWGIGQGFAILAAGTFIGEIALWFSFKTCCQGRAAKFEKKNKAYASLTQLIREKTFMFVLILRFSAVPGHITTAVSASANANFWSYLLAAFLTLPKQLTIVYLGQAFGEKSRTNAIISITTTVLTLFATIIAACYIYYQMRLLMRRNARIRPLAVVPVGQAGPTWANVADLASAEATRRHSTGGVIIITAPSHGRNGGSDEEISPVEVDRALQSGQSLDLPRSIRAQMRGWSVPHHMTQEEMREFAEEMRDTSPKVVAAASSAVETSPPVFSTSFTEANRPAQPTVSSRFSPPRRGGNAGGAGTPSTALEIDPRDPAYPPRRPEFAGQTGESTLGLLTRRSARDDSPV